MSASNQAKTVIVTGASSGIGFGVAESFLKSGANVVLNGRDEAKLTDAAKRLGPPERIAVVAGDMAERSTGRRLVEAAVERFGGVDVLVNNAGHFEPKPFAQYSEEDLDRFLAVHLKGAFFTTQAAVPVMQKRGGGAIVNITTVLASRGASAVPASAPAAAKGAINSLTYSLAVELAPENIRINAVAPGIIKTPIHGRTDEGFEELNALQPLGRVGEVKDVVDAVRYLADADFVTGVVLPVDGGAAVRAA